MKTPGISASQPGPTQPSPTQPAPSGSTPAAPPVVTMPVSHVTKPPPVYSNRIFSVEEVPPDERQPDSASFAKPLLIGIAVILLLIATSVVVVSLQTGWVPWRTKNLYDNGQTNGTSNTNNNANTSPVAVISPSPEAPREEKQLPPAFMNQQQMEFVLIKPGSFMMGADTGTWDRIHQVTISNAFYMGKYEVTQAQWQQVMGNNPSSFRDCGGNCPVEQVSWIDAQDFINKLNRMNDGFQYRLPSEAEWEYACRGGTKGNYYEPDVGEFGWYFENSGHKTRAVGGKQPNAFGLYDMLGNVTEWCEDWYGENYYGSSPSSDPKGPDSGQHRVERGGTWESLAPYLNCTGRGRNDPATRNPFHGFRVVAFR